MYKLVKDNKDYVELIGDNNTKRVFVSKNNENYKEWLKTKGNKPGPAE